MDESVVEAMARWPGVPDVFGCLSLDRRGRWRLQGGVIEHRATVDFIGRNYTCDALGRWYFQNGPQRVFVTLEYTPWVLRLRGDGKLETHTGRGLELVTGAWLDHGGNLLLESEHGVGLVDDRDLGRLSEGLVGDAGRVVEGTDLERFVTSAGAAPPIRLRLDPHELPVGWLDGCEAGERFGFVPCPAGE